MAFVQLDFLSEYLNMHTAVNIALPMPDDASAPMEDIPSLVLLHDAGEDMTSWQRFAAVERYAHEFGVAVIMPDGALSFYENMLHGGQYRDYIAKELPQLLRAYFPLSAKREKNFIAGYGMGGTGAMKIAFENPGNYAAAGVFGATHIQEQGANENMRSALRRAYGEDTSACARMIEENAQISANGPVMRIYHACAEENYTENIAATRAFFEKTGGSIAYSFEKYAGGDCWAAREKMLARFMEIACR